MVHGTVRAQHVSHSVPFAFAPSTYSQSNHYEERDIICGQQSSRIEMYMIIIYQDGKGLLYSIVCATFPRIDCIIK